MIRKGSARWVGNLKGGKGTVSTQSGAIKDLQYGFASRFENGPGSNPEELIGAAHAGCFSMAFAGVLAEHDLLAEEIKATANVHLEPRDGGFSITKVHLEMTARIPGATEQAFQAAAKKAKETCPVSRLLKAEITLAATLAG